MKKLLMTGIILMCLAALLPMTGCNTNTGGTADTENTELTGSVTQSSGEGTDRWLKLLNAIPDKAETVGKSLSIHHVASISRTWYTSMKSRQRFLMQNRAPF